MCTSMKRSRVLALTMRRLRWCLVRPAAADCEVDCGWLRQLSDVCVRRAGHLRPRGVRGCSSNASRPPMIHGQRRRPCATQQIDADSRKRQVAFRVRRVRLGCRIVGWNSLAALACILSASHFAVHTRPASLPPSASSVASLIPLSRVAVPASRHVQASRDSSEL